MQTLKIGNFTYSKTGDIICPKCSEHGVTETTEGYIGDGSIMKYECPKCDFLEHHYLSYLDEERCYRVWKKFVHDEEAGFWEIPTLMEYERRLGFTNDN